MKHLLVALTLGLSLSVSGQSEDIVESFRTNYASTTQMFWSDVEEKWVFAKEGPRTEHIADWEFHLSENNRSYFLSGGEITYSVSEWTVDYENRTVWVEFYNHNREEAGQLAVVTFEDGSHTLLFFFPKSGVQYTLYQTLD